MKLLIIVLLAVSGCYAATRRNEVLITELQGMTNQMAENARLKLDALLNAPTAPTNEYLMNEMSRHFKFLDASYDWHLHLQLLSHGTIPPRYVVFSFDRDNTKLLVAGYLRC